MLYFEGKPGLKQTRETPEHPGEDLHELCCIVCICDDPQAPHNGCAAVWLVAEADARPVGASSGHRPCGDDCRRAKLCRPTQYLLYRSHAGELWLSPTEPGTRGRAAPVW